VRRVLGLPAHAAVEALRPLGELGLDSLLAVELRNALGEDVGRRLPASLLFDHPTLDALTNFILPLVAPEPDATGNGRTRADESRDDLASLEAMSDEDVDRLLAQRLEQHGDAHGI
jgi:acyl carrier protein